MNPEQEKRPSITGDLQRGIQTANNIKEAVKAGKVIAKGGAAAGLWGAVIVVAWSNRKTAAKVLIILSTVLFIPVLLLCMLPQIIFNGLFEHTDPNIQNAFDTTVIMKNIGDAESIVRETLLEEHQSIIKEINKKITDLPQGHDGILSDPGGESIFFNTAMVLSMYNASKENATEINLSNLKKSLQKTSGNLYTYAETTTTESKEVPVDSTGSNNNDSQPQTQTIEVIVHTYTITYNGDIAFSKVFGIEGDVEKRSMAQEYAQNLMLWLYGTSTGFAIGSANVNPSVQAYRPLLEKYAQMYGIPQYIEVLMAMMMQESSGQGTDPMQSLACGLTSSVPTLEEQSIDRGVHYFSQCIALSGCTSPADMPLLQLALQGYNYGSGYISWALTNYGGYSQTNAQEFSTIKKQQHDYPIYGDPLYVPHVLRYYVPGDLNGNSIVGFTSPFSGQWDISSPFGNRVHPIKGTTEFHNGIDIPKPKGTPILAIKSGTVTTAAYSSGNGNYVVIDHGNGVASFYLHMHGFSVKPGDQVSAGQPIGFVGSTGLSTGPHLHLTIKINGQAVNPTDYIGKPSQ